MRKIIGERLEEERVKLKKNKGAMAAAGGVAASAYTNYLNGDRSPDADFLTAISAIGADVQYILTGVPSANALAPDEVMLLTGYRSMDARGKAGVLGMIGGMTQSSSSIGQQFNAPVRQVAGGDIVNKAAKTPRVKKEV